MPIGNRGLRMSAWPPEQIYRRRAMPSKTQLPLFPDFEQLLAALNAENANYLIVGAYAVMIHAQPRGTKDLDILIGPDPDNALAVFRALAKFGAPLKDVTPEGLVEPNTFFRMGTPPMMIDILPEISGVRFSEAHSRATFVIINEATGLQASFISADDLIAAKMASGRPQDLADVDALQKAKSGKKT
jgi:hypothetical protein